MPRNCVICTHPLRHQIDAALVDGQSSFRNIAKLYELADHVSLFRHISHIPDELRKAKNERDIMNIVPIIDNIANAQLLANGMLAAAINPDGTIKSVGRASTATHWLIRLTEIQLAIHEGARREAAQSGGDVFQNPDALAFLHLVREVLGPYPELQEELARKIYALRTQKQLPSEQDR